MPYLLRGYLWSTVSAQLLAIVLSRIKLQQVCLQAEATCMIHVWTAFSKFQNSSRLSLCQFLHINS